MCVKYNNKRKLISVTLSKSDQSCFNWPLIKWLVVTNCFEIIEYYWYYRRRISIYRKLQPNTPVVPQKIGKYFADFNFRGLIQTAKFRENWTTRKFPVLRYEQYFELRKSSDLRFPVNGNSENCDFDSFIILAVKEIMQKRYLRQDRQKANLKKIISGSRPRLMILMTLKAVWNISCIYKILSIACFKLSNIIFMPRHQKVAGYYVIPSEILSVRPSVCLSVRPSVRLSVRQRPPPFLYRQLLLQF